MTAPTAAQVLAAVKRSGVKYVLEDGWNDPKIAASGTWEPAYVIQHHTANSGALGDAPSLGWVLRPGKYAPIRACHFLIGRSGTVHVVYALKCYHAGAGGPGRWGDGPAVPQDSMNGHAYGIEVESKGTSPVESLVDGFTPAQFDALARLNAALLDMLGAKGEGRIINHRTWAPGRKSDTLFADTLLQLKTRVARDRLNSPPPTKVVKLADLVYPRRSESAATVNDALVAEGVLPKWLRRSYWGTAASGAFRIWRSRNGFTKEQNRQAFEALGRKRGFTVI